MPPLRLSLGLSKNVLPLPRSQSWKISSGHMENRLRSLRIMGKSSNHRISKRSSSGTKSAIIERLQATPKPTVKSNVSTTSYNSASNVSRLKRETTVETGIYTYDKPYSRFMHTRTNASAVPHSSCSSVSNLFSPPPHLPIPL